MATSGTPKRAAKGRRTAIDRPFDPTIRERAAAIVGSYRYTLWREDDEYWCRCIELDSLGDGKTPEAALAMARDAATVVVAYMLEEGQTPPRAMREGQRTEQVNIRLSKEEKSAIEAAARRKGFAGMADYMRAAALA